MKHYFKLTISVISLLDSRTSFSSVCTLQPPNKILHNVLSRTTTIQTPQYLASLRYKQHRRICLGIPTHAHNVTKCKHQYVPFFSVTLIRYELEYNLELKRIYPRKLTTPLQFLFYWIVPCIIHNST